MHLPTAALARGKNTLSTVANTPSLTTTRICETDCDLEGLPEGSRAEVCRATHLQKGADPTNDRLAGGKPARRFASRVLT